LGNGTGTDLFGEVLFSEQNLNNGPHTVEISDSSTQADRGRAWLDVDYVSAISGGQRHQFANTPSSDDPHLASGLEPVHH